MAAVARQIELHAEEDGVVAVQRDMMVDPERGIVVGVEKVVEAVPVGEGMVAVREQKRVKAFAIVTQAQPQEDTPASNPQPGPPPQRPPVTRSQRPWQQRPPVTRSQRPPVTRSQQPPVTRSQQPEHQYVPMATVTDHTPLVETATRPAGLKTYKKFKLPSARLTTHEKCVELPVCLFCGSVFLIAGAVLVGLAVTLLWPCELLKYASIPVIVFGCLTIFVGCICCVFTVRIEDVKAICCAICVGLILVPMFAAAYFEASLIIGDYNIIKNGTYIDGCESTKSNATPVALSIFSYVLLVLSCCFCLGTCINALTHRDPCLYRNWRESLCCN